ncbi:sugar phosphate isomerase/epimerase family protein [Paenibacillus sp. SI8]|uniref:sugar phosphate isomerase/epimerase family protein n=1 Tax=unclassified Paenibacillus TaxID=185978 RepID=UPI0034653CDF
MRYSICSISFRHELISFRELIHLAAQTGFSGIELWGVHAEALIHKEPSLLACELEEMRGAGIGISMISDYVELLCDTSTFIESKHKWQRLIDLALSFHTNKIRLFAGNKSSTAASEQDWEVCIQNLKELTQMASEFEIFTVIETHPRTLADSLASTMQIIREIDHPFLGVNLDFLHLWEAGTDPLEAYQRLQPWVLNVHLKNVRNANHLHVFEPGNIYSPNGNRDGMTALGEGAILFAPLIQNLKTVDFTHFAALEWFGKNPSQYVKREMKWLEDVAIQASLN